VIITWQWFVIERTYTDASAAQQKRKQHGCEQSALTDTAQKKIYVLLHPSQAMMLLSMKVLCRHRTRCRAWPDHGHLPHASAHLSPMLQQQNSGGCLLAFAQLLHIQAINPVINHPVVRERTALARAAASAAAAASTEPNHRHQQSSQATRSALL
jgi:hypothetical protein